MKLVRRILLAIIIVNGPILFAQTHDFSRSSMKYSVEIGMAQGFGSTGIGGLLSMGYVHEFWNNRLRLIPNLSVGYFESQRGDELGLGFRVVDMETIVSYDWWRKRSVSLMIGVGGFVNNTKGMYRKNDNPNGSGFFREWHAGAVLAGGLRINPLGSRFTFEISPLNLYVGYSYFQFLPKVGLEVKL